MTETELFEYTGEPRWREPIAAALQRVVDPEIALSILDVGLVYAVTVEPQQVHVLMTMTSAACPVTDMIVDDVHQELDRILPPDMLIDVELCWDPAWTPERMSEHARRFMRW